MATLLVLALVLSWAGTASAAGATITVNTVDDVIADDGLCSLREAITASNSSAASGAASGECAAGLAGQTDTIAFNIPGSGVQTLNLSTELPAITAPVVIDGTTQPGASCASWPPTLLVELRGPAWDGWPGPRTTFPPFPTIGVGVAAGNSAIRGLVITRFGTAIYLASGGNTITCNYIGTDAAGAVAQPNGGVLVSRLARPTT